MSGRSAGIGDISDGGEHLVTSNIDGEYLTAAGHWPRRSSI